MPKTPKAPTSLQRIPPRIIHPGMCESPYGTVHNVPWFIACSMDVLVWEWGHFDLGPIRLYFVHTPTHHDSALNLCITSDVKVSHNMSRGHQYLNVCSARACLAALVVALITSRCVHTRLHTHTHVKAMTVCERPARLHDTNTSVQGVIQGAGSRYIPFEQGT